MPVDGQMAMAAAQRQMDEAARRKGYRSHADMMKLTAPKRPAADVYFEGAEGTTSENLRRAYELMDQAGAYQTGTRVRDPGAAPTVTAVRSDAPMMTTAHNAGAIARGEAERVAAPEKMVVPFLPDAERRASVRTGPVAEVAAGEIAPVVQQRQVSVGQAEDTSGASAMLQAAAMGLTPSKAEAQLRQGADKLSKKQRALAASAKGGERRGAKRTAMLAIGEQGAELNQQSALLRADEMAKGREAYAQFSQQAQKLRQDALNLQATIDAARARGDADAANRAAEEQAKLYQRASELTTQAKNAADQANAEREQRAGEATAAARDARTSERAGLDFRAREGDITRATTVALDNAGRGTTVSLADAAAANRRAEDLVRRQDETDQQYAARVMAWQEANAARDQAAQTTNVGSALQTTQMGQSADRANADIAQGDQQLRTSATTAGLGAAGIAAGQQQDVAGAKLGIAQRKYEADKRSRDAFGNFLLQTGLKVAGTAIGGATGGPAGAAAGSAVGSKLGDELTDDEAEEFGNELPIDSDERLKKDVKPIKPKDAIKLADAYSAIVATYKYKDGDGETTAGVPAQKLERDPLGKRFVRTKKDGMRAVDYNGLNAAVLAGLAAKLDALATRSSKERRV